MAAATDKKEFRILALSGGGYRGLFTSTLLSEIEEHLGGCLADHFDLICGTSVGGLLAVGLANEIPSRELKAVFLEHGKDIFKKRKCLSAGFMTALHDSKALHDVLLDLFRQQRIGDLKHPVIIPAVNFTTGKAKVFKTSHHPSFETDHKLPIVDVLMATTAAPVYFPVFESERGNFVDGGLIANAPGLFGLHEAVTFFPGISESDVHLMSLGAMSQGRTMSGKTDPDMGKKQWGTGLFDLIISAQESVTNHLLVHRLQDRYLMVDVQPTLEQANDIGLNTVNAAANKTLTKQAYDRAQWLLGEKRFDGYRQYHAPTPKFYHLTN